MDIAAYMSAKTDQEILDGLRQAVVDTEDAARELNNSEWHEQCFAAAVVYAQEATRRGIKSFYFQVKP